MDKAKAKKSTARSRRLTVKKAYLTYVNPKTHNLVGYLRALQLHLTSKPHVRKGVLDKATNKLVGIREAISRGLVTQDMIKEY